MKTYVELLKSHIQKITPLLFANYPQSTWDLPPAEIRVAALIKNGKTTKKISELLYLSKSTVIFHLDNIRSEL